MANCKYTKKEFVDAVKSSISYREILNKLNLVEAGGNYATVKKKIKQFNVDTSHLLGQAHLRGKSHHWSRKIELEKILVIDSTYSQSSKLKKRLIKDNLLNEKCNKCGLTEWLGKSISLELEHKNGNRTDNRIENLELLCPNCHSQTSTFRGKNKINKTSQCTVCQIKMANRGSVGKCQKCISEEISNANNLMDKTSQKCLICYNDFVVQCENQKYCSSKCYNKSREKINWPSINELKDLVHKHGFSKTGRIVGVSDNAVRKRLLQKK